MPPSKGGHLVETDSRRDTATCTMRSTLSHELAHKNATVQSAAITTRKPNQTKRNFTAAMEIPLSPAHQEAKERMRTPGTWTEGPDDLPRLKEYIAKQSCLADTQEAVLNSIHGRVAGPTAATAMDPEFRGWMQERRKSLADFKRYIAEAAAAATKLEARVGREEDARKEQDNTESASR
ncbi:hypothetical protein LTR17_023235 [Elasticomyces elasticus]|nr:hypothetical protein LTR17_023235 [Elasticomyces elasticus]